VLGAYSALNDKESGEFAIEPLPGEALTLEYVEPDWVSFPGEVRLAEVVHDYRGAFAAGGAAYSAAGACEVDVNCPQGANFQDEKRAVALIIAGGFLCTGSLINDTANDGTQYFWTANHCGNMNNAVFRFNYERSGCGSGGAPTNQTVQGSVLIANNTNIDYRLIRITESIPASYGVYYLGWNRSTSPGGNTITIHHPEGDVKKISFDNDPPSISGVQWKISQWDLGVTEPGSSGCCLLDPSGRLIGQLYGGQAACGFPFNDFYGRFDQAWGASAAIRSALDPLGGAPVTQAGFDPNGVTPGTWTDLGFALAGLLGNPQLVGTGPLLGGQNVTLSLTNARPFSTTALVIGLSAINASFKGGTLVPFPDVVVGGISTGGAGNVPITFAWPTGLPSGFTTRFQHWIVDSTGPAGLSASNAVAGTTP
jgi:hypothetical protein